jgi:hypothetical protein
MTYTALETDAWCLAFYALGILSGFTLSKILEKPIKPPTEKPNCERCAQFEEVHDQNCPDHPDYDPTPYCSACGARKRSDCHCGPLASND